LHTIDRKVADSDSFVAPIKRAGGVWFGGGRQWHLVDRYAGTKSEQAFREVLDRGGVVGGTSAGASILGSFLVRGAREGNAVIVAPQYLVGFGYLRETGIDQHVVARGRLRDLADSLLPRYPNLLGISEDEGTAWLVRGDSGEIIGRNKAFVYGGKENDPGRPFLTLRPGDKYDLANRRVIARAIASTSLTEAFVDDMVRKAIGDSRAAIVVAQDGKVLLNKSWNSPDDSAGQGTARYATYQPTTGMQQFDLGALSIPVYSTLLQNLVAEGKLRFSDPVAGAGGTLGELLSGKSGIWSATRASELVATASGTALPMVIRRVAAPIGAQRMTVERDGSIRSNVDDLYRFELGLHESEMFFSDSARARGAKALDPALGWISDRYRNTLRLSQYAEANGGRAVFMRFPEKRISIILLTDRASLNARAVAEQIADRLLR
jgi:cyanophycinase